MNVNQNHAAVGDVEEKGEVVREKLLYLLLKPLEYQGYIILDVPEAGVLCVQADSQ
jgi:hypothetical protein